MLPRGGSRKGPGPDAGGSSSKVVRAQAPDRSGADAAAAALAADTSIEQQSKLATKPPRVMNPPVFRIRVCPTSRRFACDFAVTFGPIIGLIISNYDAAGA